MPEEQVVASEDGVVAEVCKAAANAGGPDATLTERAECGGH